MFELPDNDPAIAYAGFSKSAIDTISKIDRALVDLTKRVDEQADFLKGAGTMFDEIDALKKRVDENAVFVAEFNATGRTPMNMHAAAELAAFRKRDA
jgi:hypothetical protein